MPSGEWLKASGEPGGGNPGSPLQEHAKFLLRDGDAPTLPVARVRASHVSAASGPCPAPSTPQNLVPNPPGLEEHAKQQMLRTDLGPPVIRGQLRRAPQDALRA